MIEIPLRADLLNYQQEIVLDKRVFLMSMFWNQRAQMWEFSLATEGVEIVTSRFVILKINLLEFVYNEKRPSGYIVPLSTSKKIKKITQDNLGADVGIFYIDKGEL